jgi:SAM-dependent methyltransferase
VTPSALRRALTPRALAAWAGTDRLSTLPLHLPPGPAVTAAAKLFALYVGGDEVELEHEPDALVERVGNRLRARVSVLPLAQSLIVCDRLDAGGGTELVCWPDDSSYHLALAIPPGRRRRWLDVATGSAFAPLMRPELASEIVGTDLNPRAVAYARRGAELSGIGHVEVRESDLADGIDGTFDLVTCNAPIPADVGPLWRATADTTFFARLLDGIPRMLAPGGLAVIHGALAGLAPLVADLPGDRAIVSYVPEGGRQFGIVWWEPSGAPRHVVGYRELTPGRPHLTYADRVAVEPGALDVPTA